MIKTTQPIEVFSFYSQPVSQPEATYESFVFGFRTSVDMFGSFHNSTLLLCASIADICFYLTLMYLFCLYIFVL